MQCDQAEGFPASTHSVSQCGHALLISDKLPRAEAFLSRFPFDDLEATDRQFRHTYYEEYGVTITLATIYKLKGDQNKSETYLAMTEKLLRDVSEDYALEATWLSRTRARLNALRGENKVALSELKRAIDMGERDFRMFMHPAFNELRLLPEYQAIHRHWLNLINEERQKLGLVALEINPQPGPGALPFILGR